eukprot:TRINITY_DN7260_c0_g1_i1.p1 TRINITY_DN7260_c0_g1~~TRINITY_DN7260_c0_g1_i1.p1  ORF type:complete len:706 (+),score=118.14 TRINITY_DN7260_c0_g1_i1:78-2195(+)
MIIKQFSSFTRIHSLNAIPRRGWIGNSNIFINRQVCTPNLRYRQYHSNENAKPKFTTFGSSHTLVSLGCVSGVVATGLYFLQKEENVSPVIVSQCELLASPEKHTEADGVLGKKPVEIGWRELWELLGPDLHLIVIAIVASLATAFLGLNVPNSVGKIIDAIKSHENLTKPALRAAAFMLGQAAVQFLSLAILSVVAERMATRLKAKLFHSIMKQDISFFDLNSTGDLINRLTSDVQLVRTAFKHSISSGVKSVGQICGGVASLFLISRKLTYLMLILVPGMIFIGSLYTAYLRKNSRDCQKANSKAVSTAQESISNIRTVRAFTSEEIEEKKFREMIDEAFGLSKSLGIKLGVLQGLQVVASHLLALVVHWYGGKLVTQGQLTSGGLTSFMLHTYSLQYSMTYLSILYSQVQGGFDSLSRILEVTRMQPLIEGDARKEVDKNSGSWGGWGVNLPYVKGVVEFKDVSFSYPARKQHKVLENLNLTLEPGKVVACVGASGSGKSTIASLLERFYDPDMGEITLDGVPLRVLDGKWLRSQIGIVSQEPVLFDTTIRDNIAYGLESSGRKVTQEEVENAARQANAHDFIMKLPDGYDTIVGERGSKCSGGQRQRIAIARAILKDPKILILDEATSALSSLDESVVQSALQNLMQGRTVLVIAHRLSTIQNADLIAVVSEGKIVETGSHQQLITKDGFYAQLVKRQTQS